jgi:hypothetical protein
VKASIRLRSIASIVLFGAGCSAAPRAGATTAPRLVREPMIQASDGLGHGASLPTESARAPERVGHAPLTWSGTAVH